ncbi:MAG: hypothetical protein RR313_01780 [Anaerovoracaceae bacterium]
MTVEDLIRENNFRMIKMYKGFNPLTGEGSPPYNRKWIYIDDFVYQRQLVPIDMLKNRLVKNILKCKTIRIFIEKCLKEEYTEEKYDEVCKHLCYIRSKYDFCFWAYVFVKIKPKLGGENIQFKLRNEQRIFLNFLEDARLAQEPIRIILLKARQWGGSTLVQIYIAWIQLLHKTGWYSQIIAQTKDVSKKIKGMYSKLLQSYPAWMLDIDTDVQLRFSPYENSSADSVITYSIGNKNIQARDIMITIGTYENPDATRGTDSALVHYSEVAIWKQTDGKKPEDIIRSVSGGLLEVPLTLEVLESTPNGTGNFFHEQWEICKCGNGYRKAVFIPWYYIEHDSLKVKNEAEFAQWLLNNMLNDNAIDGWKDSGRYYWYLWEQGATFNGINWYRTKSKAFEDHADMASEAPSNDIEAFKHSGNKVFDIFKIEELKKGKQYPKFIGEVHGNSSKGKDSLENLRFLKDRQGCLKVWNLPDKEIEVSNRYLVIVDVGGRSKGADLSVIRVFDRFAMSIGGKPELVAQWRGHPNRHDVLAWKSAQISKFYNNALLVIESNSIDKDKFNDTDGDHTEYIFNQIGGIYNNLYARSNKEEDIKAGAPTKWGFQTNKITKPLIIDNLVSCLDELAWIEKDSVAFDELSWYEKKEDGSYGAIAGHHDDVLMTIAIGLHICFNKMPLPKLIKKHNKEYKHTIINESTF